MISTEANHCWIIPRNVLESIFPGLPEYFDENIDSFCDVISGDFKDDSKIYPEIQCEMDKVIEWGRGKGLELVFSFSNADVEDDQEVVWLCACTNAVTINPAFEAVGGVEHLWTTSDC